jgi:hypothetical protein
MGVLAAALLVSSGGCGSPDWDQICTDLDARSEECGQVMLQNCSEHTFGDCSNDSDIADQLEQCASSCAALAACTHIVCEE